MRVVALHALKTLMRRLAQIDPMLEYVGIGMTFFAQRGYIRNRLVFAGCFVEPADFFARQSIRHRMANLATDVAPVGLRDQLIALRYADGGIRRKLARNAIGWRIDLGRWVPVLWRMAARAIGVGTLAQIVRVAV